MDDKNKYNNALEKLQEALAPKDGREISGLARGCIEEIFPELKESEDEKIRNSIIENLKGNMYRADGDYDLLNKQISWLEKQESVEEIVARCKDSWYNEGKIAGMAEGLTDDEKYQQGWHDALKKQGEQKPWSEEDMSKVQRICEYLDEAKKYYADITEVRDCIDWLKHIEQRIGG